MNNRIAIKIGSNVITRDDGTLHVSRISHIVDQIAQLYKDGYEIILISSGAVAAGRAIFDIQHKTDLIATKQIWSAIGQVKLMNRYYDLFSEHGIQCAQVLATKESFSDRKHYLNMRSAVQAMIENRLIPIVNENDTVSVHELMFTDNDELSGLMSSMLQCQALLILSNVDGLFSGDPSDPSSQLIREVHADDMLSDYIQTNRSSLGRGGMESKCNIAQKTAAHGIDVFIGNGTRHNIINSILFDKDQPFTSFLASSKPVKGVKRWLSHAESFTKGKVFINNGARDALKQHIGSSLLAIGVVGVEGYFKVGEVVSIYDSENHLVGIGQAEYSSADIEIYKGSKNKKPFVHYNFFYLNELT